MSLISIVTPSFNQVRFISKTLSSVAGQTYADKEHVIVDGDSTDGCADIIQEAAQNHKHVKAIIEPDRGQADAINKGFSLATGDILTWLNTDDYYSDPEVLTAVAEFFSERPEVDIAWARGVRVDGEGQKISNAWVQPANTDFTKSLQTSLGLLQPSVFFRRSVYETVGGLSEEFPLQLDYEYWIRIAVAGFQFGFIDRILSHAAVHADAKSTAQRMQQLNECLRLVREKFHYVPIEWIRKHGEFYLTRRDHKVSRNLTLNKAQNTECHIIEGALLKALNGDEETLAMIEKQAKVEPCANTHRAMEEHGLFSPKPRRIVITSFDSAYFQQGINLIAALHRTSFSSFDSIVVYALGLSDFERGRLLSLEKVEIRDYPQELESIFPEYFDPKTRAYKPFAIRGADLDVNDGDLVLWMDAGLAPLKDIDEIFDIVDKQEFFITNHDDKESWPFLNINFAHRKSHAPLELDNADLLGPHLCSALIGYKRSGKYQQIVDEAFQLGKIREAVVWPKVPKASEKHKPKLTAQQRHLREKLASGEMDPDSVSYNELVSIFDYSGHRTQTLYSVLAHRAQAPVFSAKTYRKSNDDSSKAAMVNWAETAFKTNEASSSANLGGIDEGVAIYHHRGVYHNLDGIRYARTKDVLFVVGNGPSLRDFPFESLKGKAWLGMNAAYRYWDEIGIYPRYYTCFDEVVLDSHKSEIVRMISDRKRLGISKFFLRKSVLKSFPELQDDTAVFFLEDLQRDISWFAKEKITTGSFSVLAGWYLGYRDIYLLGIDLDYVERLPETVDDGRTLEIAGDPASNPNYFFDGYQLKGDRYNPPNRNAGLHLRSWAQLCSIMEKFPVQITNLNPNSAVRDFPFEDYRTVFKRIESKDRLPERVAGRTVQLEREKRFWRKTLLENFAKSSDVDQDTSTDVAEASSENVTVREHPQKEIGISRIDHARIDETAVVAELLKERKGREHVMIDVGAHFGGSAVHFDMLGWTIHCFEPDPANRAKLVGRFGKNENVTIDVRAVSDKPLKGASFFKSEESTGISGLHAFRDTHREEGKVDLTTVAEIIKERMFSKIDFLKIDVEGFDFKVLKGVPWDGLRPDVIECEYEDAKTAKMGHTWRDIAEYLHERGYSVYISEWHPIIRYGIAHDWKRVVPYPGVDVPSESWGNMLAFREDPGYAAVSAAFEKLTKKYPDASAEKPAADKSAQMPETKPAIPVAEQSEAASGEHRSGGAAKWAKLKRDPKAFCRDSHIPPLRPLQYLFRPASHTKSEMEAKNSARRTLGDRFSFLPASRKALAAERAEIRAASRKAERRLQYEVVRLRKEAQSKEATQFAELSSVRSTFRKELNERVALVAGDLETRLKAVTSAASAALRAEMSQALQVGRDSDRAISMNVADLQQTAQMTRDALEREIAAINERADNLAQSTQADLETRLEAAALEHGTALAALNERADDLVQSIPVDLEALRLSLEKRFGTEIVERLESFQVEFETVLLAIQVKEKDESDTFVKYKDETEKQLDSANRLYTAVNNDLTNLQNKYETILEEKDRQEKLLAAVADELDDLVHNRQSSEKVKGPRDTKKSAGKANVTKGW